MQQDTSNETSRESVRAGRPAGKSVFPGGTTDPPWMPFLTAIRVISVLTAGCGGLLLYDIIATPRETDMLKVNAIDIVISGRDTSYYIMGDGRFHYRESLSKVSGQDMRVGDTLFVVLSPIMQEWRSVCRIRNGQPLVCGKGEDIASEAEIGILFLTSLVSWFYKSHWPQRVKIFFWVGNSVFQLLAIVVWILVILHWIGVIPKM